MEMGLQESGVGDKYLVDTEKTSCNCCRELIIKGATICYHCGKNQNKIFRLLTPTPQWIALIVSIVLVLLSSFQYIEARKQRIFAENAFIEARKQRISADNAFIKSTDVERRVTKIAKATLPLFESLLVKTGRADGGYTSEEREKLTKALKDALIENKGGIGSIYPRQ